MAEIESSASAFAQVESLPEALAFEMVERVDVLVAFPEMGAPIMSKDPGLPKCRQFIVRRAHRVVYEYDEAAGVVYILAVQHCRQRPPTGRELKRRLPPDES